MTFRIAVERGRALILSFIWELAEYDRLSDSHGGSAREASLGEKAAEALFFYNFSTFLACGGISAGASWARIRKVMLH